VAKYHWFNSSTDHSFDPNDIVIDRNTNRVGIGLGKNKSISAKLHLGAGPDSGYRA